MDVVHSHIGKPKKMTTAQKEAITNLRVWIFSSFSVGGFFKAGGSLVWVAMVDGVAVHTGCGITKILGFNIDFTHMS